MKTRVQHPAALAVVLSTVLLAGCGKESPKCPTCPTPSPAPVQGNLPFSDGLWRVDATPEVSGGEGCWSMAPESADSFVVRNGRFEDGDGAMLPGWTDEQGNETCPLTIAANRYSLDCTSSYALPGTDCRTSLRIIASGTIDGDHGTGVTEIISSSTGECGDLDFPNCHMRAEISFERIGPAPPIAKVGGSRLAHLSGGLWDALRQRATGARSK